VRSRRDSRGHTGDTVRDREAPGSNPGPPTIFVFTTGDFSARLNFNGTQPDHNFLGNYCAEGA
jgi:hypothetical protein